MSMPSRPCDICRFPTSYDPGKPLDAPHVCSQCHMLANGLMYHDGSGPRADRVPLEVVRQRYFAIFPERVE